MYITTLMMPRFNPSIPASKHTAKVCRVTGTAPMGMLISENTAISAENIAVITKSKTAIFARLFCTVSLSSIV